MTLAEFLLARIANDEAIARAVSLDPREVARQQFGRAGRMQWFALALDRPWRGGIERVLAECAAKRRIVESFPDSETQDGDGWNEAGYSVLRDLAAVYADHPHYREEWRP